MYHRSTLEEVRTIAAARGGVCLSDTYKNQHTKLRWRCAEGHEWDATFYGVKHKKSWCPQCNRGGKKPTHTLQHFEDLANSLGGECLADSYKSPKDYAMWRCAEGHEWETTFQSVKYNKSWCPTCRSRRLKPSAHNPRKLLCDQVISIPSELQEIAAGYGGSCLSDSYGGMKTKLTWQCADGHIWEAMPNNIKYHKAWCPTCASYKRLLPDGLQLAQQIAIDRGGKCHSDMYCGITKPLSWECSKGHTWEAALGPVRGKNTWCPECSAGKSEQRCREYLEQRLGKLFPTTRQALGCSLELDGYCEELGLAFEYQGAQHSEYTPYFHRNGVRDFEDQKKRDAEKLERADSRWITVLVIWHHMTDIEGYIESQLLELGYV